MTDIYKDSAKRMKQKISMQFFLLRMWKMRENKKNKIIFIEKVFESFKLEYINNNNRTSIAS